MAKTINQKIADLNFSGNSLNSLEDLSFLRRNENFKSSNYDYQFLEDEYGPEIMSVEKKEKLFDPLINGVPLSVILKGEELIPTTDAIRQTEVKDYTVVLRHVGGSRARRYHPKTKHKKLSIAV